MDIKREEPIHFIDTGRQFFTPSQDAITAANKKRGEFYNKALSEGRNPDLLSLTEEQRSNGVKIHQGMDKVFRKFGISVGPFNENRVVLGYYQWIGAGGLYNEDGIIEVAVETNFSETYTHEGVHNAGLDFLRDHVPVYMGEIYNRKSREWSLAWLMESITDVTTKQILIESGLSQGPLISRDPRFPDQISFSIGSGYMTETRMLASLIKCLTDYGNNGGAVDVIDKARKAGLVSQTTTKSEVVEEDILTILQAGYFSSKNYSLPFKLMALAFRNHGGIKRFVELSNKFDAPIRRADRVFDQESILAERQLDEFFSAVNQQEGK